MKSLTLTYDDDQHATALKEPQHKSVAIDCPFTGKGEELSPSARYQCRRMHAAINGGVGEAR
jgi:hypothetical protein